MLPIFKCACGYGTLLERPYCPKCHDLLHKGETSPKGIVLSWTIVYVTALRETCPAGIAMVGLESGINAMAKFEAAIAIAVGDRVTIEIQNGLRHIQKA